MIKFLVLSNTMLKIYKYGFIVKELICKEPMEKI